LKTENKNRKEKEERNTLPGPYQTAAAQQLAQQESTNSAQTAAQRQPVPLRPKYRGGARPHPFHHA
jgi:hypothetical protein